MQQPSEQTSRSSRLRRTGLTMSDVTAPMTSTSASEAEELRHNWPQLTTYRRPSPLRRTALGLSIYGLLLGCCFVLAYPLFFEIQPGSLPALTLTTTFPWLTRLFWTNIPWLSGAIGHVSWLDLHANPSLAATNLLLILLGLVMTLFFLAVRMCNRTNRDQVGKHQLRWLALLIGVFALLFGLLCVFLPGGMAQNALLAALYGRLVMVYHINPYLVTPAVLIHDPLYRALTPGTVLLPSTGPLGLDLAVPLTWLTQDNPLLALLDFRLAALFLHLLNALLIWIILARLKPEARVTGTLLYAWNPLFLLLGVGEMHADLLVICCLLLSVLFLQRRALLMSWICLLLGALINPLCLLLGPLFLRALAKEMRGLTRGRRVLLWMGLLVLSLLVVVLAYAPYWSGLGAGEIVLRIRQVFWQDTARHSLLAALQQLPLASLPPIRWLLIPHHWLIVPALIIGILLLLGLWITDNIELALLIGSWIFLVLTILLPISVPWLALLPLALASASRRTSLLALLLSIGALLEYVLLLHSNQWSGQALITIGLPVLIWGWTLFFLSTWEMAHRGEKTVTPAPQMRKRSGISISRPSWPSRPAAWPSRPGSR